MSLARFVQRSAELGVTVDVREMESTTHTAEEAAAAAKTNDGQVMRPWELWKRKAMKPE